MKAIAVKTISAIKVYIAAGTAIITIAGAGAWVVNSVSQIQANININTTQIVSQAVTDAIKPIQDSIAKLAKHQRIFEDKVEEYQLLNAKRDTLIYNGMVRDRVKRAQNDKEIINILKDNQTILPFFYLDNKELTPRPAYVTKGVKMNITCEKMTE